MVLHAVLRHERPDDEVRIVDPAVDLDRAEQLAEMAREFEPDLVGLSSLIVELPLVRQYAGLLRRAAPAATIVVGGPCASSAAAAVLAAEAVDFAVVGEGELPLVQLCRALDGGGDLADVDGLVRRGKDGVLEARPAAPPFEPLDDLPLLDWSSIRLDAYGKVFNMSDLPVADDRYASLMTTRGCPYHCSYCHDIFGRRVRAFSVERLMQELEPLVEDHCVRDVHFFDDIFNYRPGRIQQFCAAIKRRQWDLRIAFPNGLRGDQLTREEIRLLRDAGCYSFSVAVETTSRRYQELVGKRLDVERTLDNVRFAAGLGIVTRAFVMIGFPGETEQQMVDTIETVADSAFDIINVFTVTPHPSTELHRYVVERGYDLSELSGESFDYDRGFINVSAVADERFRGIIHWARHMVYEKEHRKRRLEKVFQDFGIGRYAVADRSIWELIRR
ncbi:MAG: B12-binding domain-containing radical SAM protein [Deltaproteobacteria bacterium]|nr:B12-binding domain-containing radical SAM protein [Deltaproteobacteria bacterium]MBW2537010.1 B12-binding domain-containing radical SAM protein [Deltaproteobacteria bacterium]